MKCIIADDEYWVRVSLASMLMEIDPSIEIVGEVSNGAALLDVLAQLSPDLVFVDIRMPRMTGLECMRAARAMYPDIRWVILSGFPEFDFAQEAVSLGAMEYLLKPVRREKLSEVVEKVRVSIREKNETLRKILRHDMYALMYDDILASDMEEADFTAALFGTDSGLDWQETRRRTECMCESISSYFADMPDTVAFILSSGRYALVACGADRARQMVEAFERTIAESRQKSFAATACMIGKVHGANALHDAIKRCEELFELRILDGTGRVLSMEELQRTAELASAEMRGMCSDLELLPQRVSTMRIANVDEKQLENLCEYIRITTEIAIPAQARSRWPEYLNTSMQTAKNADFVTLAKGYIEANYALDIGVAQIAEVLQITPNYLSTLFRRVEGVTLSRYLTGVRMECARKLLESSQMCIEQIAREAGYADAHYFTRVFKENFGVYPTKYRKEHEKRK